jgi:hypothetical protein
LGVKNFSGHTPIFPKDEKNFPETPKNFPDILYFPPKLKHFDNISKSLSEIAEFGGGPPGPLTVGAP